MPLVNQPPELPEDEKLAADALRIQAAVKIQANYRGYMVRSGKWDTLRYKHKEAITDDDKVPLHNVCLWGWWSYTIFTLNIGTP